MRTLEIENKAITEIKRQMLKYELSQLDVALYTEIHAPRLSEVFANKRRVTADTDLRLCHFFKLKPGHFLHLQVEYDLALKELLIKDKLERMKTIDEVIR